MYGARLAACQRYEDERLTILQAGSFKTILHSNDHILIREYYNCLDQHLRGSDYEELTRFYDERNRQIQENVLRLTQNHKGKTIVVLTGDDHYPYLRQYLVKQKVSLGQVL